MSKSGQGKCADLKETAESLSAVAFKMFLNVSPSVTNWSSDGKEFSLVFEENPLTEFVELPLEVPGVEGNVKEELWYCNLLCGVVRGALEMVCCTQCAVEMIYVIYYHIGSITDRSVLCGGSTTRIGSDRIKGQTREND